MNGWGVAASFVALQIGLGRAVGRALRVPALGLDPVSSSLVHFVLGSQVSHALLLLLAWTRSLGSRWVLVYFAAALIPALWEALRWYRQLGNRKDSRGGGSDATNRRLRYAAVCGLLGIWVLPYLIQTLLPNTDWDSALHHLPVAKRLLAGGILDLDPGFAPWCFPGAVHLVYSLFFRLGAETAIIPFNFLGSAGVCLGAYAIGARFWSRAAGAWAGAFCLTVNLLWELGLDARVDGLLALYVLIGAYGLLLWLTDRDRCAGLATAGAALGLATGVKYTGLAFAAVFALLVLGVAARDVARGHRARVRGLVLAAALLALPSAWWYVRNQVVLGDPVYPLLHGTQYRSVDGQLRPLSGAYPQLAESLPRGDALAAAGLSWLARMDHWMPRGLETPRHLLNLADLLRHPSAYARSKPGHSISAFLLLFLLLPIASRSPPAWCLLVLGLVGFLVIGYGAHLLRYGLPVWPLWAVGAGVVAARVPWRAGQAVLGILVLAQLAWNSSIEWSKSSTPGGSGAIGAGWTSYLSGRETRSLWLEHTGYNHVTAVLPVISYLNAQIESGRIEADATVFMVGEGKGNLLRCNYLPDYSWTGSRWLAEVARQGGDLAEIARDFQRRRISYLLLNEDYILSTVLAEAEQRREAAVSLYWLRRFLDSYGTRVAAWDGSPLYTRLTGDAHGIRLYRLETPAPGA